MLSYIDGLLRYFDPRGRWSRNDYWTFVVIAVGLCAAAAWGDMHYFDVELRRYEYGPLMVAVGLFHLLPLATATSRRLHDSGRSGVWLVLGIIPLANLILLSWMVAPSQKRANKYGDRRKPGSLKPEHVPERRQPSSIPRAVRMGTATVTRGDLRYTEDGRQRFI